MPALELALPNKEWSAIVDSFELRKHARNEGGFEVGRSGDSLSRTKGEGRVHQLRQYQANVVKGFSRHRRQLPALDLVASDQIGENREPGVFENPVLPEP